MKRNELRLGPGAASLLMVAVVLSMSVLALLSLMNARTDLQMARRSAEISRRIAALDVQAEADFARLDEIFASCADAQNHEEYIARARDLLPAGMMLEQDTLSWIADDENGRMLECAVRVSPLGETPRLAWIVHRHMPVLEESYEFD